MKIIFSLLLIIPLLGKSHSPDVAFFHISEKNDSIIIKAELPWTIKRGLITYSPKLKNSKSIVDYKKEFFNYVKESLILTDKNNVTLKLHTVKEYTLKGAHQDQNNFTFSYSGNSLSSVKNTLLFNVFTSQRNFHYISGDDDEKVTKLDQPIFKLKSSDTSLIYILVTLSLLVIIGLIIILKKRR